MEQAAQRGCEVYILRAVQNLAGHDPRHPAQNYTAVAERVGLRKIFTTFFQPLFCNSVFLCLDIQGRRAHFCSLSSCLSAPIDDIYESYSGYNFLYGPFR